MPGFSSSPRRGGAPGAVRFGSREYYDALAVLLPRLQGGSGATFVFAGGTTAQRHDALQELSERLDYDVHQTDLGALVGERREQTQGNIREKFDGATEEAAILFFDRADALFGAPEEEGLPEPDAFTSLDYLLRRAEAFRGLVILCVEGPGEAAAPRLQDADLVVTFPEAGR